MTNGWIDIKNTDMMLIMGGNREECHPCGFKWPIEAKRQRNAKMIVVDPRFTRTAATADMFLQIRAGADIAFLGGVIKYALDNNRINKEYLVNFTNPSFVIKQGFKLPEDGLFSGLDAATQTYDKSTWNYEEGGNMTGRVAAADITGTQAERTAPAEEHPASQREAPSTSRGAEGRGEQGPMGAKAVTTSTPAVPPGKVAHDPVRAESRLVYQ